MNKIQNQKGGDKMTESIETPKVSEVTAEQAEKALRNSKSLLPADRQRLMDQLNQDVVNPIVLARAIGVRPQMIYNYIRDGRIKSVRHNNTQKLAIELPEALRFLAARMTREAAKKALLEAQKAGE
jgi:hypothetical protein